MAIEANQLPEDGGGTPTDPIRMLPKGLSKDELSGSHSDLDSSQRSTIQERHERPSQIKLSNCRKELARLIIEFEQIIKSSTLDWDKRLRIALMQRKINYLERRRSSLNLRRFTNNPFENQSGAVDKTGRSTEETQNRTN